MAPSVFPTSVFVSGELYSQGDVEILGNAEADIECRYLRIGRRARVTGRVVARHVRVEGRFAGEIHASAVELPASADISGEIWYETLQVEPGASIETYLGILRRTAEGTEESRGDEERVSQIA